MIQCCRKNKPEVNSSTTIPVWYTDNRLKRKPIEIIDNYSNVRDQLKKVVWVEMVYLNVKDELKKKDFYIVFAGYCKL